VSQSSFAILEKISESNTTSVYKAHQSILDRIVLLKILHKYLLRDKNLATRFTREAKACAILQCENIVQVYDLTEIDGAPAIVMEYVEGKSLEKMLLDSEHSEELMTKVAASVLNALSYAHGKGVVHRDIKPGNILVSQSGIIKVTDFGLAAVSNAPSLTMEGSLIGTPAYMSPEQARGETVDARTDLFSLGVTLIETLTGEQILRGSSYAECINRIQNFRPESIEKLSEKFSPMMSEFLKRLLAPDKRMRFSSAEEAADFLDSLTGERKGMKKIKRLVAKGKNKPVLAAIGLVLIPASILIYFFINSTGRGMKTPATKAIDTSYGAVVEKENPGTNMRESTAESKMSPKKTTLNENPLVHAVPTSSTLKTAHTSTDSGYISITCNPWAEVDIDSEYIGRTPIAGSIKFPVGKHTLTFNNPIFVPIVKEVDVRPKNLSTIEADFLKNAGYVFVTVTPWGDIYVDDLKRDTTPLSKPVIVSAGVRKLRIHNPSFQDIIQNLKINPGDTLRLNFNFQMNSKN